MIEIIRHIRDDLSGLDGRAAFALLYAAAGLTCISYLKEPEYFRLAASFFVDPAAANELASSRASNLPLLCWWVGVSLFFYFVLPAAWVRLVQRRKLSEIGLAHRIEPGFGKLLIFCLAIMLPLIYLMSLTAGFSGKYPFLHIYDGTPYLSRSLLIWESVYFLQFFGLEFFFRGFLVHSTRPALGAYSILAMTVPYTMIHFQKPMPEAFAAIAAGVFLGWISYRNGTIWLGLVLHCAVAFSMDILALYNKGLIP